MLPLAATPVVAQQASVVAKPAPPPPAVPGHLDILRGFDSGPLFADKEQRTLGSGSGATVSGIVAKWTTPIVYRFEGSAAPAEREVAVATLGRLASLAGLIVRPARADGADANYTIRFREVPLARAAIEKANCHSAWADQPYTGQIARATLDVNTAQGIDQMRCLVHETLHTLGLRGHTHDLNSVMSYRTAGRVNDLTEADQVLLAVLYDPRMTVGMGRLPALVLADKLIEEKRRVLNPNAPRKTAPQPVLEAARKEMETAAARGELRAMIQLVAALREGQGVAKDTAAAQRWLQRAESVDDPRQRFDLAVYFASGIFLPRDPVQAIRHYRFAAERGLPNAQNNLAALLSANPGDRIEALSWYILAANAGVAAAAQNRDGLLKIMAPADRAEAEARARAWKPQP